MSRKLILDRSHFFRVLRYARPSDYTVGAGTAAAGPILFLAMDKASPSFLPRAAMAQSLRLVVAIGVTAGFLRYYTRSSCKLY